jgi:hypothetical protein
MTPTVALLLGFGIIWLVASGRGAQAWNAVTGAKTGATGTGGDKGVDPSTGLPSPGADPGAPGVPDFPSGGQDWA